MQPPPRAPEINVVALSAAAAGRERPETIGIARANVRQESALCSAVRSRH